MTRKSSVKTTSHSVMVTSPTMNTTSTVNPRKRKNTEEKSQVLEKKAANPLTYIVIMFEKYKDDDEFIGPEGIDRFCKDLGFLASSIHALILAWQLDAQKMGYFEKKEFTSGLEKLKCYDIDSLRNCVNDLAIKIKLDPAQFLDLYKFAFKFASEVESKKSVDLESAAAMLSIVLPESPHTYAFSEFLKGGTCSYKVINRDQWICFLEFSKTIRGDLQNYNETEAWPIIMDEFVNFKKKMNEKLSKVVITIDD